MAAHRYWRAVGFESYGYSGLELSEFQLLAGIVRVDAAATLTSNIAPATGGVTNLKDDDTNTGAAWPASALGALALSWDFGAGGDADVTDIRLGASSDATKFLLSVRLQYSDDAWATSGDLMLLQGIAWPGPSTKTVSRDISGLANAAFACDFTGANNATSAPEFTGRTLSFVGNAKLSTTTPLVGVSSLLLDGTGDYVTTSSNLSDFVFGRGDFTAEVLFKTSAAKAQVLLDFLDATVGSAFTWQLALDASGFLVFRTALGVSGQSNVNLRDGLKHHVAVCRKLGTTRIFIDGAVAPGSAPFVDGANYAGTAPSVFAVGGQVSSRNAALDFNGVIDGVRVLKGYGLYDGAYTVPVDDWRQLFRIAQNTAGYNILSRTAGLALLSIPSAASVPMAHGTTKTRRLQRGRRDYLTGVLGDGVGRVRGFTLDYVNPLNKPYACRVRLVRETDGLVVREQWSKADGSYDFQYVDELQGYTVLAYYEAHAKRAVVADGLTLANGKVELMA